MWADARCQRASPEHRSEVGGSTAWDPSQALAPKAQQQLAGPQNPTAPSILAELSGQ